MGLFEFIEGIAWEFGFQRFPEHVLPPNATMFREALETKLPGYTLDEFKETEIRIEFHDVDAVAKHRVLQHPQPDGHVQQMIELEESEFLLGLVVPAGQGAEDVEPGIA